MALLLGQAGTQEANVRLSPSSLLHHKGPVGCLEIVIQQFLGIDMAIPPCLPFSNSLFLPGSHLVSQTCLSPALYTGKHSDMAVFLSKNSSVIL